MGSREKPDLSEHRAHVTGCPTCGQPRRAVSDLLTGVVAWTCDHCARAAERAQLRAQYEDGAISYLAAKYGRAEAKIRRWLGIRPPPRARIARAKTARVCRCGAPLLPRKQICGGCRRPGSSGLRKWAGRPKRCGCGVMFKPSGPRSLYCPRCKAAA